MSEESRNDENYGEEEKSTRGESRGEDRESRGPEESRGRGEDREGRFQEFRRGGGRDSRDRESRGSGGQGRPFRRRGPRRKVCRFCAEKLPIDYKDVRTLQSFLNERGKIIPRRTTGNCSWCQRQLTSAIKRARVLALLPFTTAGQF